MARQEICICGKMMGRKSLWKINIKFKPLQLSSLNSSNKRSSVAFEEFIVGCF